MFTRIVRINSHLQITWQVVGQHKRQRCWQILPRTLSFITTSGWEALNIYLPQRTQRKTFYC